MSTESQDINELDALSELVSSDGWKLFTDLCDKAHGHAACVRAIDIAISAIPAGDREAIQDTVANIRYAARAVEQLVRWPHERIAQLKSPKRPFGLSRRRVS